MASNADLYEQTLARWGTQTAALLREGNINAVDLASVAEELESFGRHDAHRLWHHLRELLVWFLAWNYAPAQRLQHPRWYVRIVNERVEMEILLKTSPSLTSTGWPMGNHELDTIPRGMEDGETDADER